MRKLSFVVLASGLIASPGVLMAAQTQLPMRAENAVCLHNATTTQTIETFYGTNLLSLPFAGTTTYDFYSPPLATQMSLATNDRGGGTVCMVNKGTKDFTISARMRYSDYDPVTGLETLMVDTGDSDHLGVGHDGKLVKKPLKNVDLPFSHIVAAGHLLHVAVTVTLISGNPTGSGWLLYNGRKDSTTIAILPENRLITWNFATPCSVTCLDQLSNGTIHLSFAGAPGQKYFIQATPDLRNPSWTTIATNLADANGAFGFIDADASVYPCRFYRTSSP